ncbi:UPF0280 family protein [Pararhodobacter sp.]|uniref:UPF0280 family protein n=1 Tax=Pararhodobacter sp. TaxID=2127056 RepID=UPI002FDCFBA2
MHHRLLPDGRRLHLGHGPIDLIVQPEGPEAAVAEAYRRAVARFDGLLEELVTELPLLRQPVQRGKCPLRGPVARRMWQAAARFAPAFVTPMAGVAGAVAEAVLRAMTGVPGLTRASVNNGGDIALFLAPGAMAWRLGVVVDPLNPASPGVLEIGAAHACRGVATSGAKGRSHSLGIADSVTVLATDAPTADVAATLLANSVDLPGHPSIIREPAQELSPDSDLGARLVTVSVGTLTDAEVAQALDAGEDMADAMRAAGHILGAVLVLQGRVRLVGRVPMAIENSGISNGKLLNV